MLNTNMRLYDYSTIGGLDDYGQPKTANTPIGQIKIAIYISSQTTQDNVNYKDCTYVGVTQAPIDDTYVITYGEEKLKVMYVNKQGRYNQVFLKGYNG